MSNRDPNSKSAPVEAMQELHASLVELLKTAIHETEVKVIELPDEAAEGGKRKVTVRTRPAAILNVARQLLKDNNIEAAPKALADLQKSLGDLPFPGDDPGGAPATDAPRH